MADTRITPWQLRCYFEGLMNPLPGTPSCSAIQDSPEVGQSDTIRGMGTTRKTSKGSDTITSADKVTVGEPTAAKNVTVKPDAAQLERLLASATAELDAAVREADELRRQNGLLRDLVNATRSGNGNKVRRIEEELKGG